MVSFSSDLAIETEAAVPMWPKCTYTCCHPRSGGAGLAVLAVHARGGVHGEDRGVPEQLAVFGTEAKGVERQAFAFFDGTGEVDFAVQITGELQPLPGTGLSTSGDRWCTDVDRQLRVGVALGAGSSELRPVVGVKMQSQGQGGRPGESSFHGRSVVGMRGASSRVRAKRLFLRAVFHNLRSLCPFLISSPPTSVGTI